MLSCWDTIRHLWYAKLLLIYISNPYKFIKQFKKVHLGSQKDRWPITKINSWRFNTHGTDLSLEIKPTKNEKSDNALKIADNIFDRLDCKFQLHELQNRGKENTLINYGTLHLSSLCAERVQG